MIEGEQRVRFAAAEVRLQIDNGITSTSAQALQGVNQQRAQTMRQEGALEEVARDAVLVGAGAAVHLSQVGSKLGEQVTARGNIRVWSDDLTPGAQTHAWFAFNGSNCHLARLIACLFIETQPQQFLLLPLNLAGLLSRRDGCE